jgi:hypothetical protein
MSNESPDQGKCYDLKRRARYFIGQVGARTLSAIVVCLLSLSRSFWIRVQRLMRSARKCLLFLDYPRVLKIHPWAIAGIKVDCAIDEPVRGASDTSLSFHRFPKQVFPLPLS